MIERPGSAHLRDVSGPFELFLHVPAGYADDTDTEALRSLAPDLAEHDVYVCGPDAWTDAVLRAARAAAPRTVRLVTGSGGKRPVIVPRQCVVVSTIGGRL